MAKVTAKKVAAKAAPKKTVAKKAASCAKNAKKVTTKCAAKVAPKKTVASPKTKAVVEEIKKARKVVKPKNENTLSYTQTEFLENVRAFCGLAKRSQAKELCEDMSLLIKDALKRGYKLPLLGLGKMYVRSTKAGLARNPATGETIKVGPRKRVRFVASKALKDFVL